MILLGSKISIIQGKSLLLQTFSYWCKSISDSDHVWERLMSMHERSSLSFSNTNKITACFSEKTTPSLSLWRLDSKWVGIKVALPDPSSARLVEGDIVGKPICAWVSSSVVQVEARATINVFGENPVVHIISTIHKVSLWEKKGFGQPLYNNTAAYSWISQRKVRKVKWKNNIRESLWIIDLERKKT